MCLSLVFSIRGIRPLVLCSVRSQEGLRPDFAPRDEKAEELPQDQTVRASL